PILVVANDPKVLVVGKDSPYQTMEQLADDMKARPGKVRMSHTGPGGSGHVQGLIYQKFGMQAAMTGYSSGSECLVAVLGGQVDFTNANLSSVAGYLESGDLRLLAASSKERLAAYPDTPALTELFPDMEQYLELPFSPLSLMVRGGTAQGVVDQLRTAATHAVATDDWKDFAQKYCLDKLYESYPDEETAREFYNRFESVVSWLIYDAGAAKYSPEQFSIPQP
ncbi:MAG: tripartite tricarboxylate transporter substrate-binding protein, partial [Angelakisella sp.]